MTKNINLSQKLMLEFLQKEKYFKYEDVKEFIQSKGGKIELAPDYTIKNCLQTLVENNILIPIRNRGYNNLLLEDNYQRLC